MYFVGECIKSGMTTIHNSTMNNSVTDLGNVCRYVAFACVCVCVVQKVASLKMARVIASRVPVAFEQINSRRIFLCVGGGRLRSIRVQWRVESQVTPAVGGGWLINWPGAGGTGACKVCSVHYGTGPTRRARLCLFKCPFSLCARPSIAPLTMWCKLI